MYPWPSCSMNRPRLSQILQSYTKHQAKKKHPLAHRTSLALTSIIQTLKPIRMQQNEPLPQSSFQPLINRGFPYKLLGCVSFWETLPKKRILRCLLASLLNPTGYPQNNVKNNVTLTNSWASSLKKNTNWAVPFRAFAAVVVGFKTRSLALPRDSADPSRAEPIAGPPPRSSPRRSRTG